MKRIFLIISSILFIQALPAQKAAVNPFAAIDRKALDLPDSQARTTDGIAAYISATFQTPQEKSRAIFIWVASKIRYDLENMFAINFYESRENKIKRALETRKGICENFAALFTDICNKSGIKCFTIEGYTRQNGFTDYIPHAWCAAFIDGKWRMFDPTWGSGYVYNGKFVKKINNFYFNTDPALLIRSHMPFDYLWQFLTYPVSNQEFYEGKTSQRSSKPLFSFIDSLELYQKQTPVEQMMAEASRIERNGVKNSMIFDRLQHIKVEIENNRIKTENETLQTENDRQNKIAALYNQAIADYNQSINDLNTFIDYRNHQFQPEKPDDQIKAMLDTVDARLTAAKKRISLIENPSATLSPLINQLSKSIEDIEMRAREQSDWLKTYLSKPRSKRKSMFYEKKTTLFHIPIK